MASYDEALQKMYSDRLTRFYRNYDEAKVASVPKPCGNRNQPVARANAERRLASMAYQLYHHGHHGKELPTRRGDGVKQGPRRVDGVRGGPRRRLDVVGVRMTERWREKPEQEVSRDVDDREKERERDVLQTETQQ